MSSKYEFIDGEKEHYPLVAMCRWAKVSRSGFYEWRNRPASATAERRIVLAHHIREVFDESDETYGYRRVWAELARRGIECGPELVRRSCAMTAWSRVSPVRGGRPRSSMSSSR